MFERVEACWVGRTGSQAGQDVARVGLVGGGAGRVYRSVDVSAVGNDPPLLWKKPSTPLCNSRSFLFDGESFELGMAVAQEAVGPCIARRCVSLLSVGWVPPDTDSVGSALQLLSRIQHRCLAPRGGEDAPPWTRSVPTACYVTAAPVGT